MAKSNGKTGGDKLPENMASFFLPLSEGERADSLRYLLEDKRLAAMAKVGRYRLIAAEPLVPKTGHPLFGHRLARLVIYDYSGDRCVEAAIDLRKGEVAHLSISKSQPMLSLEEEELASQIASADPQVQSQLALHEQSQSVMQYWSHRPSELAHSRRTAAVLFGQAQGPTSFVALVDLLDAQVTKLIPAHLW